MRCNNARCGLYAVGQMVLLKEEPESKDVWTRLQRPCANALTLVGVHLA